MMNPDHKNEAQLRMETSVEKILGESLGALPWVIEKHWIMQKFLSMPPFTTSFYVGLVGALILCLAPSYFFPTANQTLFEICFWASMFFFLASWLGRVVTQKMKRTVAFDFAHLLDDTCKSKVADRLSEGFHPRTASIVALGIAIAGTIATGWALKLDLARLEKSPPLITIEFVLVLFSMFLVYFISARATFNARFYLVFSEVVRDNFVGVFQFEPQKSVLIQSLTKMARRMLLFWICITVLIATLPLLFFDYKAFALLVVPTTLFLSLGLGSIQFLAVEKNIRETVHRASLVALIPIEKELAEIQIRANKDDKSREEYLWAQRKRITQGGNYGSVFFVGLSAAAPLLGPLVGYIASGKEILDSVSGFSQLFHWLP